jgi:hypothetical protein
MADLHVVPQETAKRAANLQDVHTVLDTCGMYDQDDSLDYGGLNDDTDWLRG